jgi:hypothetical protein
VRVPDRYPSAVVSAPDAAQSFEFGELRALQLNDDDDDPTDPDIRIPEWNP